MKTKRKKRTTKQNHSKIQISVWRYFRITFILFLWLLPCLLARLLKRSTAYMLCCSVPILLAHSHTTRLLCLTHSLTHSLPSLAPSLPPFDSPTNANPSWSSIQDASESTSYEFLLTAVVGCQNWFFEMKPSLLSSPSAQNVSLVVTFLTMHS